MVSSGGGPDIKESELNVFAFCLLGFAFVSVCICSVSAADVLC